MDTKFSSAIHTLILISESKTMITSEQIAVSVGTNASYIRKLTTLMKKANLIESLRGVSGFSLVKKADRITMLDIYQAVTENKQIHFLDIHQNPNDKCIVGKNIKPVLTDMFRTMEQEVELELQKMTLQDCISQMKKQLGNLKAPDSGI